jgi:hypothetical protein
MSCNRKTKWYVENRRRTHVLVEDGINILIWQEKDWMTDPHIFSKLSDARKCSAIHGGYVLHFDTITYAGRNEKRI